jgi:hypothetical protein
MPVRKPQICIVCKEPIETNQSAVGISLFSQTVGMGKQRTSKSERLYLCPQCALHAAIGQEPPKSQPFNVAAYKILRYLIAADPDVMGEAFKELRHSLTLPVGQVEVLPPARRLAS